MTILIYTLYQEYAVTHWEKIITDATLWEKIFSNNVSIKGPMSRIYEHIKAQNSLIGKQPSLHS
jgi:hypothetical protein